MNNTLVTTIDKDAERRRALAKVYALLIRLAEEREAERKAALENPSAESEESTSDDVPAVEKKQDQ